VRLRVAREKQTIAVTMALSGETESSQGWRYQVRLRAARGNQIS